VDIVTLEKHNKKRKERKVTNPVCFVIFSAESARMTGGWTPAHYKHFQVCKWPKLILNGCGEL
jgi:hypothetical protein